ncbi:serine/threonine-protein kinase [uncultured Cellulomonas sp.]|uniref:serine/threonine-protein kinase n=1 Tax=uncultured Cellulomonas sp. TaxID=189682 RepID=UPI0026351B03|nr:serine/threonine-protein kinase [uncultured Cellulomonas sp.]
MTVRNKPDSDYDLPEPADGEVALLLQSIWDLLAGGEHWPRYSTVDRQLYRERKLDVDAVLARTPETLLLGGRFLGSERPNADAQLSLTAAGAAACVGSELALKVFLAAVQLAAEAELRTLPDGQDPIVTFEDAAAAAGVQVTGEHADGIARQSGLLLHAEPWTGHMLLHQGGWRLSVDRRARPYADVVDLAGYWRLRERQGSAPTTPQLSVPSVEAPSRGDGRVLHLRRRWEVGQRLGSGGFGQVFIATGDDGTAAAVKFVPKEPGAERELLFAELDGVRNVVPVIDSGEVDDAWVLVMPRAQHSLQDRLDEAQGRLGLDEVLAVLRNVGAALTDLAARSERIVHRDIKPGNVLLLGGAWCLADFGISRYAEASTAPDSRKLAMSPPYAAPERWRAERATAAADVYAVGVMAFQMLSGSLPFAGPGWEDYREQHLHEDAPPLHNVSPRLAALVAECLQKPPQARPAPEVLISRLQRANRSEQFPGVGALAIAYHHQVGEVAAEAASRSRARSEAQRREELATAASRSLDAISAQLLEVVLDAAPGVEVERRREMKWIVQLSSTRFGLSAATPFDGRAWGGGHPPNFDIVAFATVSVLISTDAYGHDGRSHSLYYCDAQREGSYAWYETAFMHSPLVHQRSSQDPFALPPGQEAAKALSPGIAGYQVAWPFTELVIGELEEFIDRWVGWFAAGVQGKLAHPSTMPERSTEGTWRRG